ncbi:RNA-directed DNA polymerase from mobile element jockey [Austrofundulus limnaeus]|uniref:RNA-directed DNA polymerase from mobile element jockey n=1 Tax=Austrofundulus limnaeus TaxID=52670 RepID=A0A2I4AUP7_AUSLI|nr:PREDICTED: RNA-directed DNA polymerase from mobile element jockey-like [Austrofundulus limnaeus]
MRAGSCCGSDRLQRNEINSGSSAAPSLVTQLSSATDPELTHGSRIKAFRPGPRSGHEHVRSCVLPGERRRKENLKKPTCALCPTVLPTAGVRKCIQCKTTKLALLNVRSLTNKTFIMNDFFCSNSLDFMFLTETWLSPGELSVFSELLPVDCTFFNTPRLSGRGGGVLTVFKKLWNCRLLQAAAFQTFELLHFELGRSNPLLCAVIYRSPKTTRGFISELSDFLTGIFLKYDRVLILGDFNLHVCCPDKPLVHDFLNLIHSFNLVQNVVGPTHQQGHTLDLVLSHGLSVLNPEIGDATVSDHKHIFFEISLSHAPKSPAPARSCRIFNNSTAALFSSAFTSTAGIARETSAYDSTQELLSSHNETCTKILDLVAPLKVRQPKTAKYPWINEITRAARRLCRRAERKWKNDKLQVSFILLKTSLKNYQSTVKTEKNKYFSRIIKSNSHNPRVLFSTVNSILNVPLSASFEASPDSCNNFAKFFVEKVETIRSSIPHSPVDTSPIVSVSETLTQFKPISLSLLNKVVGHMKPSGSPVDPIPPSLFKEVLPSTGPAILNIINSSITTSVVPDAFKHAVVTPLLKKPGLDPSVCSNYRPISKLPFLSKILEKIVYTQLNQFLNKNNVFEIFQSGIKSSSKVKEYQYYKVTRII